MQTKRSDTCTPTPSTPIAISQRTSYHLIPQHVIKYYWGANNECTGANLSIYQIFTLINFANAHGHLVLIIISELHSQTFKLSFQQNKYLHTQQNKCAKFHDVLPIPWERLAQTSQSAQQLWVLGRPHQDLKVSFSYSHVLIGELWSTIHKQSVGF